jgi:transposase-like protein
MTGRDNRIEVVSVAARHQQRSWAEKARIVAEAEARGSSFGAVANRHGVHAAQIYTWRKVLRTRASSVAPAKLVPVQVVAGSHGTGDQGQAPLPSPETVGVVEVRLGDSVTVRISGVVPVATLTAVFGALKALPAKVGGA